MDFVCIGGLLIAGTLITLFPGVMGEFIADYRQHSAGTLLDMLRDEPRHINQERANMEGFLLGMVILLAGMSILTGSDPFLGGIAYIGAVLIPLGLFSGMVLAFRIDHPFRRKRIISALLGVLALDIVWLALTDNAFTRHELPVGVLLIPVGFLGWFLLFTASVHYHTAHTARIFYGGLLIAATSATCYGVTYPEQRIWAYIGLAFILVFVVLYFAYENEK